MINKHSIYNWLFFPLLVLLLAGGATSCINDPAMEEEDTSGKSTLSIMVRGITITPGTDDYVKTLRVIGYDNTGAVVCNQKYSGAELGTVEGTDPNTYIEITQTLEDAFQGGVCDFYFIANEDEYSVYNSQTTPKQTLSAFLGDKAENAPQKVDLSSCIIAFDAESGLTPGYPILMTVHSTSQYLKPGDNSMGTIQLVRCLARVQLNITKDASFTGDVSVGNVHLTGSCTDSYSLWNTGTYTGYTAQPIDRILYNVGTGNGIFTSSALMFPEKLGKGGNTVTDTDLKYTFSLTSGTTTKNYEIGIGKGQDTDQSVIEDYNIYRNHWYKTNVNFLGWQSQIKITYEVDNWKEGGNYELGFAYPTYTNPIQPVGGGDFPSAQPTVYYNSDANSDDGTFQCQFTITGPVGQVWQPTLLNTTPGDYEIIVYKGIEKQNPPYGISDDPYTLKIRALKPENVDYTVELGISYTPQWDPSATSLLLINGTEGDTKWPGSDDPEKIVIKQIEIPSVP
mgnify:FL=1